MKKEYIFDEVFCIKDFLSEKVFNHLEQLCLNKEGWDFNDPIIPPRGTKAIDLPEHDEIWEEIESKVKSLFPDNMKFYHTRHIQVFLNDMQLEHDLLLGGHSDDSGYKTYLNIETEDPVIHYGCILYLNDDFDGGELHYINQNIDVRPQKNTLVVHPGSDKYLHGVNQVYNAKRYTLPFFIMDKKYIND